MKNLIIAGLVLLILGGAARGQSALASNAAPDRVVRAAVGGVIAAVRADARSASASADALSRTVQIVDRQFMPYTDFEWMTQLAVGKAWEGATSSQRKQLIAQFRTLFVRTYAASLAEIRSQQVKFKYKPFTEEKPDATDAVVQTQAISNGDVNEVDYRLRKAADGWKIYDINMMGAWLIRVYRKQFAALISKGGIDGLLKFLIEHNTQMGAD